MRLTRQQRAAFDKLLREIYEPSVPETVYDIKGDRLVANDGEQLVEGVTNEDLLNDPRFQAGWKHCAEFAAGILGFILVSKDRDLENYAGYRTRLRKTKMAHPVDPPDPLTKDLA